MKLSQVIRKGARLRPQAFGYYYTMTADCGLCSCALGSALEHLGYTPTEHVQAVECIERLRRHFPDVPSRVFTRIAVLNDTHRLTREQIAFVLECQGY